MLDIQLNNLQRARNILDTIISKGDDQVFHNVLDTLENVAALLAIVWEEEQVEPPTLGVSVAETIATKTKVS